MLNVGIAMRILSFPVEPPRNWPDLKPSTGTTATPIGARPCFRVWNSTVNKARAGRMQGGRGCATLRAPYIRAA